MEFLKNLSLICGIIGGAVITGTLLYKNLN